MTGTSEPLTLDRLLRDLPNLDVAQLLAISAAHNGIGRDALERARAAAGSVARTEGILDELHELHGTIVQWVSSRNSYSALWTREGAFDNPLNRVLHDSREQAQPAMLDAATGLFLEQWLTEEDHAALVDAVEGVIAA